MREHFEITSHLIKPLNFAGYASAVVKDLLLIRENPLGDSEHAKACIDWLLLSADVCGKSGFSASYALKYGWDESYPETTGYIIPTLLNALSEKHRMQDILTACSVSGEWLLRTQNPNGSWNGHRTSQEFVFDTGQIIFGLLALHRHVNDERYLRAAERGGDWIVAEQEANGSWVRHAYGEFPHTYYARAAWALAALGKETRKEKYFVSARKNLDWVLSQQGEAGWFMNAGFHEQKPVVLHAISYTLEGLMGASKILEEKAYADSSERAVRGLMSETHEGIPFGYYRERWCPARGGKCLTGIAQLGIVLKKLHTATKDEYYGGSAKVLKEYLKTRHRSVAGLPRALAGAAPVWGRYLPYLYPNWAQKFFLDLLLVSNASSGKDNDDRYEG